MQKCEIQQRIAFGLFCESLRSTAELTYAEMGSTMEFGARRSHWYWRQTPFQKDNGHTEVLSVRLTDYFGIEWQAVS